MRGENFMQVKQNGSADAKEMLGLIEPFLAAFLSTLDEKRLLEISRQLVASQQRGELSNPTFNYLSSLINTQWANRIIQPLTEKLLKNFAKPLSMHNASMK